MSVENESGSSSLRDHFLIAMPGLSQSIFANSLTYICEHNDQGAMGIIVNHPLELSMHEVFAHLKLKDVRGSHAMSVMAGGPVDMNRGFVLHRAPLEDDNTTAQKIWAATVAITNEISLTTSMDILSAIARDEGPRDNLVALGYAGWSAGQLEGEIAANAWLTMPADSAIIFDTPWEQRVLAATTQLGVSDLSLIAPTAGHA